MDTNLQLIITIIIAIIGIVVLLKVLKNLAKIAFIIVVVLFLFFMFSGGEGGSAEKIFQNTTISELMDKHCTPKNKDGFKCQCLVTPVYNDLNQRFSKADIKQIEQNKKRMTDEMLKSYKNRKTTIHDCLKSKGQKGMEWISTIKDWIQRLM